jgi:hypothetical protein
MRLYLNAKSKNNIGYTPDWLKVSYAEDRQNFELTLDIQGDIDYDPNSLDCRCKGDLIPWVLYNNTNGSEIDLYDLSEEEVNEMFPIKRIAELLRMGTEFIVGIYPVNDSEENLILCNEDTFSDCVGTCELYDGENDYEIRFEFETEYYG